MDITKMTPLERYQYEKRSGQYHPETEKNWPSQKDEDPKPVIEDSKPEKPPKQDAKDVVYYGSSYKEPAPKTESSWHKWLPLINTLLLLAILYMFMQLSAKPKITTQIIEKPQKVVTKYKEAPPRIVYKSDKTLMRLALDRVCYLFRDKRACHEAKKYPAVTGYPELKY